MNPIVLVPDGVGVRNFVLGRFLDLLSERGHATVLHAIPPELLPTYANKFSGRVQWESLRAYTETPLTSTLRYSLAYAQMYWVATNSMRLNARKAVYGSWRTRAIHGVAKAAGRAAASARGVRLLDRWHCCAVGRLATVDEYCRLFERIEPSVLFCSHQRPPIILPPVLAARRLGIPTATFIFSWDNLSSKGRIAAPFDRYLVWSELMREDLLRYYPDVSPDRVHVVGTPQFDPYSDERLLLSREEFFAQINADPSRPLICYSGGDIGNCAEDHHHVRTLLSLIRSGAIKHEPQVLLRPAPVDEGSRYREVRRDYPELIYAPPAWTHTSGDWAQVFPLSSDVGALANITRHADVNVNFGSTMTLDFALHDKPVVNPVFDITTPPIHGMPLGQFLQQFEHYRAVAELGAARYAASPNELADYVNAYLDNPSLDREGRRRLVELQVMQPLGQSSGRIINVLARLGGTNGRVGASASVTEEALTA